MPLHWQELAWGAFWACLSVCTKVHCPPSWGMSPCPLGQCPTKSTTEICQTQPPNLNMPWLSLQWLLIFRTGLLPTNCVSCLKIAIFSQMTVYWTINKLCPGSGKGACSTIRKNVKPRITKWYLIFCRHMICVSRYLGESLSDIVQGVRLKALLPGSGLRNKLLTSLSRRMSGMKASKASICSQFIFQTESGCKILSGK